MSDYCSNWLSENQWINLSRLYIFIKNEMWIWCFMVNQYDLIIYLNCNPTDANQWEVTSNQQGVKFQEDKSLCSSGTLLFLCHFLPNENTTVNKSQWYTRLRKSTLVQKNPEACLPQFGLDIISGLNILFSQWHVGLFCYQRNLEIDGQWDGQSQETPPPFSVLGKYIFLEYSLGVARSWPGLQK